MGWDWDDILAYKTETKTVIRHRTIGGLYYFCMLAILGGYVIFYEFYLKEGWGLQIDFSGSLRTTAKASAVVVPLAKLPYCDNPDDDVYDGDGKATPAKRLPCMSTDDYLTNQGSSQGVLIGTRLRRILQYQNEKCGELQYGCERWVTVANESQSAFVGNVEGTTVLVQHAVAPTFEQKIGKEAVDTFHNRTHPRLEGPDGHEKTAIACSGRGVPEPECPDAGDLFTVADLIAVANIDLDGEVPGSEGGSDATSLRYEGLTVRVNLFYEGYGSYYYKVSTNPIKAKMHVCT